jgi:hypothetical protein
MLDLKKYRETRATTVWKTKDGVDWTVKKMETSHVQNTVILLDKKVKACAELGLGTLDVNGKKAEEWIEILKTELKFRQDPKSVIPKKEEVVVAPTSYNLVEVEEML